MTPFTKVPGEGRNTNARKQKKVIHGHQYATYVHVRARRGQATDSHSLAERARREKISERMSFLQSIVPGCDKITGKAQILDEIINHVQTVQYQVEFLQGKLASVSPMLLDGNIIDRTNTLLRFYHTLAHEVPQSCNPVYFQLEDDSTGIPFWETSDDVQWMFSNEDNAQFGSSFVSDF